MEKHTECFRTMPQYCLVKFVDDDILHVVPSKSINQIEENLYWAPYKKMGFYESHVLQYNDDRKLLEKKMRYMKQERAQKLEKEKQKTMKYQEKGELEKLHEQGKKEWKQEMTEQDMVRKHRINNDEEMAKEKKEKQESIEKCGDGVMEKLHSDDNDELIEYPEYSLHTTEEYEDMNGNTESATCSVIECNNSLGTVDRYQFDNSDDSIKDPDYNLDTDPEYEAEDNLQSEIGDIENNNSLGETDSSVFHDGDSPRKDYYCSTQSDKEDQVHSGVVDRTQPTVDLDYKELDLFDERSKSKRHFCKFCLTLQTKFARHLQNKHKTEESVKQFVSLEKRCELRTKLIKTLRTEGDLLYNTTRKYNFHNNLIVVRRPMLNKKKTASHYKPCGKCGGMYAAMSLSSHYRRCELNRLKGSKDALINSKKKSILVSSACPVLRNEILPVLRDDEITRAILADDLIIAFGNRMCQKYRSPHLYKMIRARLRCVAKMFLILKKKRTDLHKFEQFFDPEYYDTIISSINEMCQLNEKTGKYKSASTAFAIGSYLKKISFYLLAEFIKMKNKEKQSDVKDFLQLLQEGLQHDIYKTVEENQRERTRRKVVELPSSHDIIALRNFLDKKRNVYMQLLKKQYSYENWKGLMSVVLISLQLFNRRRAGEIERVKIEDYLKYERLKDDDEMLGCISSEERNRKKKYVRFLIRGKRCRGVPVIVNRLNFESIQMILKFRKRTNISEKNPYLFGIPGKEAFNHLLATQLLCKYSKLCGAKKPNTLRGTELRKHIATKCGTMNLGDIQLKDVADYLGHNEKIHLEHYRLPSATKDIMRMSNILEYAQGSADKPNSSISNDIDETFFNSENGWDKSEEFNNRDYSNTSNSGRKRKCHKKLSWTNEEKECVKNLFKTHLEVFELPSLDFCDDIISRCETLSRRSATQLKAYVSNCIEKQKKNSNTHQAAKVQRKHWGSTERNLALTIFQEEIKASKLPSLRRCEDVLKTNHFFVGRTPSMMKAFVNNTLKKLKKNDV